MAGTPWTPDELATLQELGSKARSLKDWKALARQFPGRTSEGLRNKFKNMDYRKVPESVYPSYDKPLVWEGDALVLPDPEFPFHNAEWINKVVGLARAWGITHLVIAGDMLHLESLSSWEPSWTEDGELELEAPNLPRELGHASKAIEELLSNFETIDLIMGNHEGRMLRALDSVLSPGLLLRFMGISKVRSAPYYFMTVLSNNVPYLIEHPKTTARGAPGVLADKYQAHVLMAHSHRVGMTPSRSGEWMGWHIGHAVDERKLAYASQRHNAGDPHALGAAIIRNGYVYVLFENWVDWAWMAQIAS